MSKYFNILSLHSNQDIHPRTWVCIKGKKINIVIKDLETDLLTQYEISREELSRSTATTLKCSRGVIKRILQGKSEFYPIPIILELIKKCKDKKLYLKKISENIDFLKINSASSKPVKAVNRLSGDLAKIIGAFMADGSFNLQAIISAPEMENLKPVQILLSKIGQIFSFGQAPSRREHYISMQINSRNKSLLGNLSKFNLPIQCHYNIELTEEYKDSVLAFNRWMKSIFTVNPTNFNKKKNAWRTIFSNKIIARYLMSFFDINPGPKTYTAYEPKMIQKSTLRMRKDFARGVLMFDGCVTKSGKITFNSKSKNLALSVKEIWKKDGIDHGVLKRNKRNEWVVYTTSQNKYYKLLDYFEPDTQKSKLLYWINGDKRIKPVVKENLEFSVKKILLLLKKIKSCDINFLEQNFKKSYTSIRYYLNILERQKSIRISSTPCVWSNYISEKATVYLNKTAHDMIFSEIRKGFNFGKNVANILDVHKATFSAWKLRKNRIPLGILKDICYLLNIKFETLKKAVIQTDRDIIELI